MPVHEMPYSMTFKRGGHCTHFEYNKHSDADRKNPGIISRQQSPTSSTSDMVESLECTESTAVAINDPVDDGIWEENRKYHKLNTPWTFYYLDPLVPKSDWDKANKEVICFDTVEAFWGTLKNIQPVSRMKSHSDYSLFRVRHSGIKIRPAYEDEANKDGGVWRFGLSSSVEPELIDRLYRELLMVLVGEQLGTAGDHVTGIVVACRQGHFRFGIWTSTKDPTVIMTIGDNIRNTLRCLDLREPVEFFEHKGNHPVHVVSRK